MLEGMRRYIEANGGEFRLGTPALKVVIENDKVKGIEAGGAFLPFDKVINTIPLPYVPRVMPDLPTEILDGFRSVKKVAVACIIAKLKKPVTENFRLNTNDPEMDIPGIVEYTNLRPLDHHVVYAPFYSPGEHPKYQEANSEFIDKVKRHLMKINSALKPDDFLDLRASRYRFAQPISELGYLDACRRSSYR